MAEIIQNWWLSISSTDSVWLGIGLFGQLLFTARWLFQWLVSEKQRRSTMPPIFWYASLIGGALVLAYGIHKMDPVIVLGQFGVLNYARNIYLIRREQKPDAAAPDATSQPD